MYAGKYSPPFKFARRIVSVSIQDWVNSFNFLSNLILIQLRLGEINTKPNNLHVRKGENNTSKKILYTVFVR